MKYILLHILFLIALSGASQEWNSFPVEGLNLPSGASIGNIDVVNNVMYFSGGFSEIGGISAEYIASYNGITWDSLGEGLTGDVQKFILFQGKTFCGGGFMNAGGNPYGDKLDAWDGTTWQGFGNSVATSIEDLAVYQGKLFGIGNFSDLFGANGLNDVFQYDGSTFTDLNGGVLGPVSSGKALEVYDDLLIAGGRFLTAGGVPVSNLAAWDGSNWTSFAGGTNAVVFTMFTDTINEYLFISGSFTFVGGTLPVSYFAKWDGANWFDIDGGVSCNALAMELYQNQLYIGGCFDQAGGKPIKYIARYNGTEWDSLGTSNNNELGVQALAVFQDELYVGGNFTQIGDTVVPGLAKWSFPLDSACKDMYAGIGAHPDTIYTGQLPYTFRSGCYGNSSLQWEFSDGFISSKGHTSYDFNNTPGTYDIMLTAQCGTYADTVYSQVVIVSNVGIEQEDQIEMKIYPNPSDGKISIQAKDLKGKEVGITIYDILGKEVYKSRVRFNSEVIQLDLNLSKGSYELALVLDGERVMQKLVIE